MAQAEKIQTGEIIPRDYGIIIQRGGRKIFIAPMNYIIGGLILATPEELGQKISQKASELRIRPGALKRELAAGIIKREGTDNLLRYGGRSALRWAKNYNTIAGEVISKSEPRTYGVQIAYLENPTSGEITYASIGSDNPNEHWAKVKSKERNLDMMIDQTAALDIALYKDNRQRNSAKRNITGLFPRDRPTNHLPFRFSDPIDVLIDYYIEGKNRFELNKALLTRPETYSQELLNTFQNNPDSAYFAVIRQSEKEQTTHHSGREYFGAVKALEKRIIHELKSKGFEWDGYGLEFRDTPNQTISKRYRKAGQVYAICTKQDQPPIIVYKKLGEKAQNWITAKEARADSPYKRTGIYTTIDDTTRRESWAQVIVPGKSNSIFVPQILRKAYANYS